jgi:hypothetical protein
MIRNDGRAGRDRVGCRFGRDAAIVWYRVGAIDQAAKASCGVIQQWKLVAVYDLRKVVRAQSLDFLEYEYQKTRFRDGLNA